MSKIATTQYFSSTYYALRDLEAICISWLQRTLPPGLVSPLTKTSKQLTRTNRYYAYFALLTYLSPVISFQTVCLFYGSRLVTSGVKLLTKQPRPYNSYSTISHLAKHKTSYSLPSQSMMSSLIVQRGFLLSTRSSWLDGYFQVVIALLSFTRMYRGLHYPHDFLISWILVQVIFRLV